MSVAERTRVRMESPSTMDFLAEAFDRVSRGEIEMYPSDVEIGMARVFAGIDKEATVEETLGEVHNYLLAVLVPIVNRAKRLARIQGKAWRDKVSFRGGAGDVLQITGIGSGELGLLFDGRYWFRKSNLCSDNRIVNGSNGLYALVSEDLQRLRIFTAGKSLWQQVPHVDAMYNGLTSTRVHLEYGENGKPGYAHAFVKRDPFAGGEPELDITRRFK